MISRSTGIAFLGAGFILALGLAMPGCGGGRETPGTTSRMHPANWITAHPASAMQSLDQCTVCHEMTALKAGSAIPSCMTTECHHGMSPGYAGAGSHGALAKAAPGVSGGGLASCQMCHGQDFAGGGSGSACASCHRVKAPHPPKPWHDASGFNHAITNPVNGPICGQCHFAGSTANPEGHPATPAPAGTPPGCYNNTECHGAAGAPHLLGSIWKEATSASFHGLEAKKDLLYCQSCHGTPGTTAFNGGAATTKCSTCHAGAGAHSTVWYPAPVTNFPGNYVASHRNALKQDTACPVCHDYTKGRTAPLPAAPSCFSSSSNANACHANGPGKADHPIPFTQVAHTTVTQAGFDSNCQTCHAVTGSSPVSVAPACSVCHQGGSPLTLTNCTSCHEKPPAGTAFPDVAGAHAKHNALAGITAQCSACHQGSDSGSQAHYDRANGRPGNDALRVPPGATGFLSTYNGKAGNASFDGASHTCSNVSCHGGITTPHWQTGTIATNTDAGCKQCHTLGSAQGTPENNSPYSGAHGIHMGSSVGALCTDCHSMTNGTVGAGAHFLHLDTPQMEGPSGDTIQYQGSRSVYDPVAKTCTLTCHGQVHNAFSWSGMANHPVPFLQTAHTAVTQGGFNTDCSSCHAVSGTSPLSFAPACSVCHQAGSPLTVGNCASCHEKPPAGTVFPDVGGAHAKHDAITNACATCHQSYDTGSQAHYDRANARPGLDALRVPPGATAFPATYNAKTGAAAYSGSANTCSNMSCHGGITTPNWTNGTIASSTNAGCLLCHILGSAQGTPQNNSPYSGRHSQHLGGEIGALCTDCHSMTNSTTGAANHFAHLDTSQMEGPASDTIQYQGSRSVYNASAKTCTLTCHGQTHNADSWTGGGN